MNCVTVWLTNGIGRKELGMFNPTMMERIRHQMDVKTRHIFSENRKKQLDRTDFTIISNNCWGGVAYEYYGLPKQSPTVGTYFFAEDYINFLENFENCIDADIEIIKASESRHAGKLFKKGEKDADALIEAVEKFIHLTNEERRQMGLAGRKKVEEEFDREIVVEKYMEELRKVERA